MEKRLTPFEYKRIAVLSLLCVPWVSATVSLNVLLPIIDEGAMRSNPENLDVPAPVQGEAETCVQCSNVFNPTVAQAPEFFICDDCERVLKTIEFLHGNHG